MLKVGDRVRIIEVGPGHKQAGYAVGQIHTLAKLASNHPTQSAKSIFTFTDCPEYREWFPPGYGFFASRLQKVTNEIEGE